ncbi:MAG: alpha-amylase family glycosyl hydrolase [Microcoleus sp.]
MSSSIEFKLFAPYNKAAALIGSFSDWKEIPMQKDDKGCFCTSVKLDDGVYHYKFRVQSKSWFLDPDQWVEIIDPYATDIDDSAPNSVARIKDGKRIVDTYVWQHDDKPLPSDRELVIYEMHIGSFCCEQNDSQKRGNFQSVTEKLDYLCELGINAIELMPVTEHPGDKGWGYNVRHFFATESSYGATEDLKRLIDECHARGIRILMDGTYDYSDGECPLMLIDRDYWYYHGYHYPDDPQNHWGPEFNYEHYDSNLDIRPAWHFIGDVVRFWIQEYHIDGIRYDALHQLANDDFMHWITQQSKQAAGVKPFYDIGERIPETPSITGPTGPMDGCWHDSFHFCILGHICGDTFDLEKLKDVLDAKRQGFPGVANVINYLTNHDHNYVLAELGDRGIFDEAAFKRVKLGAVLLMTAMGVPMLWMGEEFGEYKHKSSKQESKLEWSLLNSDRNRNLFEYYKGLIALRKHNPALQTANIEFFHENPDNKVLAYVRWNDEGSRVVVVVNFSDRYLAGYCIPHFPANGTWHEWTRNYDVTSDDNQLAIDLGDYEVQVFVWQ